ncbi:MAG TPA: ATP-binding protein [Gaiellaceae bacterium]|nr:ATP-binding protein [Gaiellaceae bacterium]
MKRVRSPLWGIVAGAGAVAAVTAVIALVDEWVPVLSLGVLYVFAVLPIATFWGLAYAIPVAVASMLAFNWFFLPPVHTFTLADRTNWFALAVYVGTAVVVSHLAAGARRRAEEAEQREREAALLADVASELLRGRPLKDELPRIAERTAALLGVSEARIELGAKQVPTAREAPHALEAGGAAVGTLYTPIEEEPGLAVQRRLLPPLASLLAVAAERDRLAGEAFEAEALRRSDTIKTAVIQAVSHDLRTPLATIEAALDGLESGVLQLDEADREGLLETIRSEHGRLKRLVDNLLDLSRLEAGAATPNQELWTADELVSGALEEIDDAGRVQVSIPEASPPIRVDAIQVQRILANLIDNALKFSPADEPVTVRVNATRSELLIRVIDHGPGVPEQDAERIFQAFHRPSGAADSRGAGLGLAIARGFARANGGRVWVESRPGQGASFAVAFPIVEVPAEVRT